MPSTRDLWPNRKSSRGLHWPETTGSATRLEDIHAKVPSEQDASRFQTLHCVEEGDLPLQSEASHEYVARYERLRTRSENGSSLNAIASEKGSFI